MTSVAQIAKPGKQELSAPQVLRARGDEAGDEDRKRDEVAEHEQPEQEQSRFARPNEPAPAEGQRDVDRQ